MNIQDVTGFNAVQYNALVEQAEARGVTSARVDEALLSAIVQECAQTNTAVLAGNPAMA